MSAIARWAPHAALVAAIGALVVARDDRRALLLFIPLAIAPGLGAWRLPPRLARTVAVVAVLVVATAAVHAIAARSFLSVPGGVAQGWASMLAWALGVVGVLLVLLRATWPSTAPLVAVIVALLAMASLGEENPLFTGLALASAAALWLFAFVQGGPSRVDRGLFVFAGLAVGAGVGVALLLPWTQARVERLVAAQLHPGATGFAEASRLGELERLGTSRRLVLRVWTPRPRRLRASALTRFDGREWTPAPRSVERENARPVLPLPEPGAGRWLTGTPGSLFLLPPHDAPPSLNDGVVETQVLPVRSGDWPVLHPADAVLVRADASRLEPSGSGGLRWPLPEDVARYLVLSRVAPGGGDGAALSDAERAETLALPASIDPRLRIRARILADGTASDRERVARTMAWLRTGFTYTLDTGAFRTDDPLAEFLFEKKRGYCSFFATAAAVLLRLQGVPTRYVKGFNVGLQSRVADHYRVVEADAHAWVDAWLPGEGWVEADPTPEADYAALHPPTTAAFTRFTEAVRARGALLWAVLRSEGVAGGEAVVVGSVRDLASAVNGRPRLLGILLGAAVAFGLVGGARLVRARWRGAPRPPRASLPPDVLGLLEEVERHFARVGRARPPTRGLREHLESIPPEALSPASRATSARAIEAVYRCAFAGHLGPASEVAALRRDVARLA